MARYIVGFALFPAFASAFLFSYSAPTECGSFNVSWDGGSPPFTIQLTPIFDTPRIYNVPDSSISNGKGSYTLQLPIAALKTFLVTMSDNVGFGTGGTSDMLTVGDPLNGATCNTTVPGVDFEFQLNTALQQCRPYVISDYTAARQPVYIRGLIPLGDTFLLQPPTGPTQYSWTANVKAGTRVILFMTDSQGRQGGASDLLTIGASNDQSCINADSPGSTANSGPTATTASTSASATSSSAPSSGGGNGGAIAGGIIGGVVVIAAIAALVWFILRRKRKARDTPHIYTHFGKRRGAGSAHLDMLPSESERPAGVHEHGDGLEPVPYVLPVPASSRGPPIAYSDSTGADYPPGHPASGWGRPDSMATSTEYNPVGQPVTGSSQNRSSKFSEAYASSRGGQLPNTPARFVLHTDAGTIPHEQEEEEIVELPPQYTSLTGSAARRPSQRLTNQAAAGGSGSSAGPSS